MKDVVSHRLKFLGIVLRINLLLWLCYGAILHATCQGPRQPVVIGTAAALGSTIKNPGINLFGSFHLTDDIRCVPGAIYFFPKSEETGYGEQTVKLWELNLDGHYLFIIPDKTFNFYGLAGLNFTRASDKGITQNPVDPDEDYYFEKRSFNFGINAGAGFEMGFGEVVSGLIDIKYVISEIDQAVVRIGINIILAPAKARDNTNLKH